MFVTSKQRRSWPSVLAFAVVVVTAASASADLEPSRFSAAGYFRVMTRPDLQGGDSQLGFWNLYGRLLNERPYALLDLRLNVIPQRQSSTEVWTRVHARIEGGSVGNMDSGGGNLQNFRLSQLYAEAGNILLSDVTWRVGSLQTFFGDLGLYDFRPAELFFDTVGLSARYQKGPVDLIVGAGDAGYFIRGSQYSTILTAGATVRITAGPHLQLGAGAQGYLEPESEGNRFAPYDTPEVDYENFIRGEVAQRFLEENPGMGAFFPDPVATSSDSFKLVGYLGFGGLGPLKWSALHANLLRRHPDNFVTETAMGESFDIYVKSLTDERYQINIGNEMLLTLVEDRLDAAWGVFYGRHWNRDNGIKPDDDDRTFYSTVLRLQFYLNRTFHVLTESSVAHEESSNGNLYRNFVDSVFQSTAGIADPRGLEFGDANTRNTWQGKFGFVLNPLGYGIYTRPSLRILYGVQYSTQN
ncbi:MAG: hypothetical protein KJO07_16055, partial [Deltaproteobacteria bacterium]|nr:hypothetical protein [Deltaproteobacteria bacterium]